MTPRETVIEAMARAVCAEEGHNPDMPLRDGARVAWKNYVPSATAALDAFLAALPGLGLKVVPVEAEVDMLVAGTEDWLCVRAQEDRAEAIWSAMLAASPDLLGGK